MWYISFHGGSEASNNIHVYHDSGKPHSHPKLLPTGGNNPPLKELRGFQMVGDMLYVVNGYKDYSQVLLYQSDGKGGYIFLQIFAGKQQVYGMDHPYDLTFDAGQNCYVSSQDTNVVMGLSAANTPIPVAPYLLLNYPSGENFYPGTQVASSIGQLPNTPSPYPPNVATPQGLDVQFESSADKKVAHSVRGILWYEHYLFVADEPANAVKIYSLTQGELYGQIEGQLLEAPVQLLVHQNVLYIGSSGNDSVVQYDLSDGVPSGMVSPSMFIDNKVKHISGMAFGKDGNFYAAERKAKRILQFPSDGSGDGKTFISDLPDYPEFIAYVPKQ